MRQAYDIHTPGIHYSCSCNPLAEQIPVGWSHSDRLYCLTPPQKKGRPVSRAAFPSAVARVFTSHHFDQRKIRSIRVTCLPEVGPYTKKSSPGESSAIRPPIGKNKKNVDLYCQIKLQVNQELKNPSDGDSKDPAANMPTPEEPVKVVLADDDKDDQEIFHDALKQTEVPTELTQVNNGEQLIEHLKDPEIPNPDIVFMDINMPKKDGKEVLAEIKSDENLKDIPTVILSTSQNPKEVEEAFHAGANLYVPKPSSFGNFILLLKRVFSLRWTGELLKPIRERFFMSEKDLR